jgi:hypothetical protein
MPALDLGPADVHVDGGAVVRRKRLKCAACGAAKGWTLDGKRTCTICNSPFIETPHPHPQPIRAPTAPTPPASTEDPGTWISTPMATKTLGELTTKKRKSLEPSQFALPEKKAYPIHDAAHVRNAAARLEQAKKAGKVSPSDYRRARRAIARAAKRFGIKSQYLERSKDGPKAPGSSVTVRTHPSGFHRIDVHHNADRMDGVVAMADRVVFCDEHAVAIDLGPWEEIAKRLADAEAKLAAPPEGADKTALETDVAKLRDELVAPRWNQLARVGTFKGHPAGPFELSPAIFDQILKNYREVDQGNVPIDFEHASEADETSGSIPQSGAPATGYIRDVQNRGAEGLWGLCEFLEPGLGYVRAKRYRCFSPAIRFGARHPETGQPIGARLTSVALVTRPFLRGMRPLAARDPNGDAPGATVTMSLPQSHHELMKTFKAYMKLGDLATHADMKASLGKLREHAKEILDKPAVSAMGHYSAGGVHLGDYIPPLAEAINAPAHMPVSEILDACEDMIDAAMERHEAEFHPMADQNPNPDDPQALAIALGDTKGQLRAKESENRALTAEKSAAELKLKDAQAKVDELTAANSLLSNELKTAKDADEKRVEASIKADVDEAFATYKDAKKLGDVERDAMTIVLKSNPELFRKLYPKVAPNHAHLMRTLGGGGAPGPTATPPGGAGGNPGPVMTPAEQVNLADKLIREKKMDAATANSLAFAVAMGQRPMPTF